MIFQALIQRVGSATPEMKAGQMCVWRQGTPRKGSTAETALHQNVECLALTTHKLSYSSLGHPG